MKGQSINKFSDQLYFNHVRDALWRRPSQASVMIGSGFSRYANKVRPDAGDIPLWSDLADALSTSLSVSRDDPDHEVDTQRERPAPSALDLAQKYEHSFGRARLHQFLIESVSDEDYRPTELHRRLLKLPWKDIFTTNWDTLLERCLPVPEQSYSLVTSVDHLPISAPPRIVKLHGSFPGTFPLIVTRKDYNDYPKQFAPFVNTVQQAMMESVILLLGFSGHDPNFRRWLGWVRANLGADAPRIYLAGWLRLSETERAELMGVNVVPIDLYRHPKASTWPEPLRHSNAMEWLILSMERGRPYPAEDWPSHLEPKRPSVSEDLEPVQSASFRRPNEEPWDQAPGEPHDHAYLEKIREVLCVWRNNRECYPSWLVIPFDAAQEMRLNTDHWERLILAALPNFADAIERLDALAELVWRREVQLDPILAELEAAVAGVLKEIDCQLRHVGGEVAHDIDWRHIRHQWRTLAAALVTTARFEFDREKFEHWIDELAPFKGEDEDVAERVGHETCLWMLNCQDYAQLDALVNEWKPRAADPAWLLRKAALLSDLGRTEEARKIALSVLDSVRSWSNDPGSLARVSYEAWALWLAHAINKDPETSVSRLRELKSRFRELAQYRCDPRAEFRAQESAVVGNPPVEKHKPFELGMTIGKGWSFSNVANFRARASLRAIRLVEVVGSPSAATGSLLNRAAEALLPFSPEWTASLTVRSIHGSIDRRFSKTLSRWRVAFIPLDFARSMADSQRRTLKLALEKYGNDGSAIQTQLVWRHRLETAIEALSRFVLRLEPAEIERVLKLARSLYVDNRIRADVLLAKPLANLLRRSWESLPTSLKAQHALKLLSLPIVDVDEFTVESEYLFEDPGSIIDWPIDSMDFPAPMRSKANERTWVEVTRLVDNGLQVGGSARKRAALRLAILARWRGLRPDEQQRLADSLWEFGVDSDGLPQEAALHPWVFLMLPEQQRGHAEKRLRAAWVRSVGWEGETSEALEKVLGGAGAALERSPKSGHEITLTNAELASLRRAVARWAEIGPSKVLPWGHEKVRPWRQTVVNISSLLLRLDVRRSTAQVLLESVRKLGESKTPAYELLPGIVKSDPRLSGSAADLLRVGLGGSTPEQREQAASAFEGLTRWLRASALDKSGPPQPPVELVFEIGVIIAAHRWFVLSHALKIAAWVFEAGTEEHRELLRPPVLSGLEYLQRALVFRRVTNSHPFVTRPEVNEDDVDVPWLRLLCVRLAVAMDSAGLGNDATVVRWLEAAGKDPLPELRFTVDDWQSRRVSASYTDSQVREHIKDDHA